MRKVIKKDKNDRRRLMELETSSTVLYNSKKLTTLAQLKKMELIAF